MPYCIVNTQNLQPLRSHCRTHCLGKCGTASSSRRMTLQQCTCCGLGLLGAPCKRRSQQSRSACEQPAPCIWQAHFVNLVLPIQAQLPEPSEFLPWFTPTQRSGSECNVLGLF